MKKETADQIVEEVFSANPGVRQIAPGRSIYEYERAFATPRNLLRSLPDPLGWLAPLNVVEKENHGAVWAEAYVLTPGSLSKLGAWLLDAAIHESDPVEATLETLPLTRGRVHSVTEARQDEGNERVWTFGLGADTIQIKSHAHYDRFNLDRANVFAEALAVELGWLVEVTPAT